LISLSDPDLLRRSASTFPQRNTVLMNFRLSHNRFKVRPLRTRYPQRILFCFVFWPAEDRSCQQTTVAALLEQNSYPISPNRPFSVWIDALTSWSALKYLR
jgi:hypothetical protein